MDIRKTIKELSQNEKKVLLTLKKLNVFIGLILLIFLLPGSNLSAQVSLRADFLSSYIWRGFDLNPYQEPVLQPQIGYKFGGSGLALDIWSSFSFKDKEQARGFFYKLRHSFINWNYKKQESKEFKDQEKQIEKLLECCGKEEGAKG